MKKLHFLLLAGLLIVRGGAILQFPSARMRRRDPQNLTH